MTRSFNARAPYSNNPTSEIRKQRAIVFFDVTCGSVIQFYVRIRIEEQLCFLRANVLRCNLAS